MTEAIAHALRSELKRERDKRPLRERLEELAHEARAKAGPQHTLSDEGGDRRDMGPVAMFVDTSAIVAILSEGAAIGAVADKASTRRKSADLTRRATGNLHRSNEPTQTFPRLRREGLFEKFLSQSRGR